MKKDSIRITFFEKSCTRHGINGIRYLGGGGGGGRRRKQLTYSDGFIPPLRTSTNPSVTIVSVMFSSSPSPENLKQKFHNSSPESTPFPVEVPFLLSSSAPKKFLKTIR